MVSFEFMFGQDTLPNAINNGSSPTDLRKSIPKSLGQEHNENKKIS